MQIQNTIQLRATQPQAQRISLARPTDSRQGLIKLRCNSNSPITETELRNAIYNHELEVVYQSSHRLDNFSVVGYEAMVRWRHPERGLLMPGQFIGLAESSHDPSIINGIWEHVLQESMSQLSLWQKQGVADPSAKMGVNISTSQILRDDGRMLRTIVDTMSRVGLPMHHLDLEMSESIPLSNPHSTRLLADLHECGVNLTLDDFGVGKFDIARLLDHPFSIIKIDRMFASGVEKNPRYQAITRNLVSMTKDIGAHVIGEGVETQWQAEFLSSVGADGAQGYYFSSPASGSEWSKKEGSAPR